MQLDTTGDATGMRSVALRTDHYELTMVEAALAAGVAERRSVFEVFARRLPLGRRFGVVAGLGRILEQLPAFRFSPAQLDWLSDRGVVTDRALEWLAGYRFGGTVTAYAEGECYFPGSPVLTVEGGFAECVLLETLVLSVLNHDAAVASAGARMVTAARGRRLLEFGGRRTHEDAAVAAARAAYAVGFDATSNLAAGERYGIPTSGTSAHAFTLLFDDEPTAFAAQVAAMGPSTTLLVDTYDTAAGIANAVAAAGPSLGAVRIDSGDLVEQVCRARRSLDRLGATETRIVVSGDLDEYRIAALAEAPVDDYGVGTRLVTGSGAPTGEFVYKLVATSPCGEASAPLHNVAKGGGVKATLGGRKGAWRLRDADGAAVAELVRTGEGEASRPTDGDRARPLQHQVVIDGVVQPQPSLGETRRAHLAAKAELPADAHRLDDGEPAIPTVR